MEWISVNDNLPNEGEEVEVLCDYNSEEHPIDAQYICEGEWYAHFPYNQSVKVYKWKYKEKLELIDGSIKISDNFIYYNLKMPKTNKIRSINVTVKF